MVEPTEDTLTCATCGSSVSKSEWHPAAVDTTTTGETIVRSFCSETCREGWGTPSAENATA